MEESTTASVNLFGKYELGRLLGYGGFAKVYHARNVFNGQSVAVKAVSKKKIISGGLMALVQREISIMRRLRHPYVIRLYEVLATKTKIYYVLEFAKGGELFAKIAKGRFSEDLSRKYFQQLITAVGFCHARGVFHRDLKPENLLLDENWDLKISDFGLSAVKDPTRPNDLLNTLCGTPAYVAPEILAKKGYDGAKIDIWSCGVILFVLIAGYLPFNDTNLMAMYRKIYKGQYRFPKWTSPELRRLLSRLLDVNPDTRITVDEILNDPWFRKDYKEKKFNFIDLELKEHTEEGFLNAFDIIAFAPGVDLTGLNLLKESGISTCSERFVSRESPETIIERVGEVTKKEEIVMVEKREWGAKFEGKNGKFVMTVEVGRLTEQLVVVEIRGKEVLNSVGQSQEIWKHRLRPQIAGLFCESKSSPSG